MGLCAGPCACETLNWLLLLNQHEEWIIITTSYHYRSDLLWFICRLIPIVQLWFLAGWMCWYSYCFNTGGRQIIAVLFLCSLPFWMMSYEGPYWHKGPVHHFGKRYEKLLTRQKWNNSPHCKSFNLIIWAQRSTSAQDFVAIQNFFSVNSDYSSSLHNYLMAV